jgi:acetylornithine deacetylase/succinyl-diaminopimelate desuccinylase-like protein
MRSQPLHKKNSVWVQRCALMLLFLVSGIFAQQIAKLAPFGTIFVPSRDGISHSPKEFTSWPDVANGVEVLYRSVLLVDDRLNRK